MEARTTGAYDAPAEGRVRRMATETKQAFKTTEFWVYVTMLLAILIAGTVDNSEGSQFGADDVWLYATILTGAYLLSRGIAKSGSRDPYWGHPGVAGGNGDGLGDRVKAAAQVLTDGQQDGTNEQTTTAPAAPRR
ncbi:MAG TPA: hypothetical protein VFY99_04910 [Solirubrobacterales bacterium]